MNDLNVFESGVAEDPRSEVEKGKDWRHEEIAAAAAPVQWTEKLKESWRKFPRRDQSISSSCMAQSGVKMLGIENVVEENVFVELSAKPVYQARANNSEGMWQQNLLELLSGPYACLESDVSSQHQNESEMNYPKVKLAPKAFNNAETYRASGYLFMPIDIDQMAAVISQGKAVHLLMFFTGAEYWKEEPTLIEGPLFQHDSPNALRHGITAVDFTLYNGKKALVIEDSAGGWTTIDESGQRILTEDFLKARCYGAGYVLYRKNQGFETADKPQHTFAKPLVFGMMGDQDVVALQDILKYEGFFATNVPSTGNMLQQTCAGLKKWQLKHGLNDYASEPDIRKVRFGTKSIGLANSLYSKTS